MKNKRSAIITGGAGFIGSHLCEQYLKKGFNVICVDNLLTGLKDNIEHLLLNPNFSFLEADVCKITDMQTVSTFIENKFNTIEYIHHFA
jgi:nucleoside-diphosphate-sugar epimerase